LVNLAFFVQETRSLTDQQVDQYLKDQRARAELCMKQLAGFTLDCSNATAVSFDPNECYLTKENVLGDRHGHTLDMGTALFNRNGHLAWGYHQDRDYRTSTYDNSLGTYTRRIDIPSGKFADSREETVWLDDFIRIQSNTLVGPKIRQFGALQIPVPAVSFLTRRHDQKYQDTDKRPYRNTGRNLERAFAIGTKASMKTSLTPELRPLNVSAV
jgi:hypothetical protein